ncbi:MAG: hypothetical protein RIS90_3124 [Pseudomonadota bacterium]|jgi:HD-GYP domain-containing protein (c-di-GMP phosphodiesterase class II)
MLKKIPVSEVQVGMFLHELAGTSWLKHPYWKSKFLIRSQSELDRLRHSTVTHVWIDVTLGDDVAPSPEPPTPPAASAPEPEPPPPPKPPPPPLSLERAVEKASEIKNYAKVEIKALYEQARLGHALTTAHLAPLVSDISDSVLRNPGVLTSLSRLKHMDDYTYLHSVTVCALMVALGQRLGLADDELRVAGMAGLLHDVGKARIPLDILNKPGKLTPEEFEVVKQHPRDGFEMLAGESGASGDAARDVALHHHETLSGRGYPEGLAGDQISLLARMGAICDVYDAITSNRPYKAGWDPSQAMHSMAGWAKAGQFDQRIFEGFVRSVGIYPTGSLVKLQSGRLAVVLEQHPTSALTPRIKVFFSTAFKLYIVPQIIDLARPGNIERIVGRELPETWGIDNLDELWTGLVASKG